MRIYPLHIAKLRAAMLAVCCILLSVEAMSQTTYYSRNGATLPRNWNEADSWTLNADGSGAAAAVPSRTDNVVILNGHNIIIGNLNDNGSAGVSANGLGQSNVGAFAASGDANFYQTGNIYVRAGGTLTANVRVMFGGITTILGTITTSGDLINLGRLEIGGDASSSIGDDFILTGFSQTIIYNTTTSSDDIYLDHTDAEVCGDESVSIGDVIQYLNGATSDQICSQIQVTGCATCPETGTGNNTIGTNQGMLARGAIWRYLDDGTDQGTAWIATSFDDSGWAAGNAELGYGDGDETTVVSFGPDAGNKYITTYFRTTFFVNDASEFTEVLANIKLDDGAVVYINGTEVIRSNMPTGTITYTTLASSDNGPENEYQGFTFSPTALVDGTNYIAVEIHQGDVTSSDISLDMEILGKTTSSLLPAGSTWSYLDDGTDPGSTWVDSTFDDSGWSSGAAKLGFGDGDETTTVSFGGDANNKHTTTYFRTTFTNTDATVAALELSVLRDDGVVIYLNGNEILRDNMPTGTITNSTFASSVVAVPDESTYFTFEVPSTYLVVGTNYLAVEVHQVNLTSSDLGFDMLVNIVEDNTLLPVSLVSFGGEYSSGDVRLSWSTATEKDNDYFLVERSSDGKVFEKFTQVRGAGDSKSMLEYTITDATPLGSVSFYRLTQFDYDGQFEVLGTIRVQDPGFNGFNVVTYPNPASERVFVRMDENISLDELFMSDLSGRKYYPAYQGHYQGVEIDLSDINPGIYLLNLELNGKACTETIIIR